MDFDYFSRNGEVLLVDQAVVPLKNVEYSYGFGVYETLRLSNGTIYFSQEHCQRLMDSAAIISLEHNFKPADIENYVRQLVAKNGAQTCNVKILLIGGQTPDHASLYIMCLNPLFPDRRLYRDGVACVTHEYQRDFPHAKTLNMLPSYLAYKRAKQTGAFEALLINKDGYITEGTRSNFLTIKDRTIFSPPLADILPGITRQKVLKLVQQNGFEIVEKQLKLDEIDEYDGAFLTSTSSKIMPIKTIDSHDLGSVSPALSELMAAFDEFLAGYEQNEA